MDTNKPDARQHSPSQPLTCFFSFELGDDVGQYLFEVGKSVANSLHITAVTGQGKSGVLRRDIVSEIERTFALVADTTRPNWWIAWELFSAIDRKFCLLLEFGNETIAGTGHPVFSERKRARHSLPLLTSIPSEQLKTTLRIFLQESLATAEYICRHINQHSLRNGVTPLPSRSTTIDPRIKSDSTEQKVSRDALFRQWLAEPFLNRVALIGAPGSGKTFLLWNFARHIRDTENNQTDATNLTPISLALSADAIKERLSAEGILKLFAKQVIDAGLPPPKASSLTRADEPSLGPSVHLGLLDAYKH